MHCIAFSFPQITIDLQQDTVILLYLFVTGKTVGSVRSQEPFKMMGEEEKVKFCVTLYLNHLGMEEIICVSNSMGG